MGFGLARFHDSSKLLTIRSLIGFGRIFLQNPIFMSFQFLMSGATLCAVVLSLSACSKPAVTEEPVRAVKVITVGTQAMLSGSEYAGEVRARVESRLGFRVGGKIVRRQAGLGQRVKVGDVLAQLDAQDLKLASEAARAQLNAASTNRDLAAADFKRFKDLRDQNFISAAELERREASLKAAQAQVDQAQAQFSGQGNQAAYAALVADTAGVVTAVEAEVGQVVGAGTPVVRIAQDGPRDVVFSVPEDKILKIKIGSEVSIRTWANPTVFKGSVREVAASADPVTRTFSVKVTMQAKEALPLGVTVSVTPQSLDRSGPAVIKLPTSAFHHDGKNAAVWVLDPAQMTVKLQPVVIATADGNDVVVSQGLQPGMKVVAAGVHVLSPGQKVTVYQEKPVPVK
jgi:RND family efflux transporter MFP subunit